MPEYQTARNSDNQGVKETSTQTNRRGRDRQPEQAKGTHSKAVDGLGNTGLVDRKLKT